MSPRKATQGFDPWPSGGCGGSGCLGASVIEGRIRCSSVSEPETISKRSNLPKSQVGVSRFVGWMRLYNLCWSTSPTIWGMATDPAQKVNEMPNLIAQDDPRIEQARGSQELGRWSVRERVADSEHPEFKDAKRCWMTMNRCLMLFISFSLNKSRAGVDNL